MPPLETLLLLLALGAGSGFLAGLLGVGGGLVLVPFLTGLLAQSGAAPELQLKMAVATAMATILLTSISAVRAQHRRRAIEFPLVRGMLPGLVGGTACGALLAGQLSPGLLSGVFGLLVGLAAWRMLRGAGRPESPGAMRLPARSRLWVAGGVIGLIAALVGAGGAFISVPLMARWRVPLHRAVATASTLGLPLAAAGTLAYAWAGAGLPGRPPASLGYIHLPTWAVLISASVLTAPLGTRVSHATDVARLRRVFAVLLMLVAAEMLRRALV